jgi:hypothetical protein
MLRFVSPSTSPKSADATSRLITIAILILITIISFPVTVPSRGRSEKSGTSRSRVFILFLSGRGVLLADVVDLIVKSGQEGI